MVVIIENDPQLPIKRIHPRNRRKMVQILAFIARLDLYIDIRTARVRTLQQKFGVWRDSQFTEAQLKQARVELETALTELFDATD